MIEVEGLRKSYGDVVAVDGISFQASPGEVFGLLGPNGAGKSTTIGCISGLLAPGAGHIRVMGHNVVADPRAAKETLGVVPQELALYEEVSARENLDYWGSAYGLRGPELKKRIQEVLEHTNLVDLARTPVKKMSGGQKRRLNFACGIVHRPKIILLDEPTVGVDPQTRVRLLELVREEAAGGACVLYTTHYMEEAQLLCDRIGVVDHGKLIALGTFKELQAMVAEKDLVRLTGRFDPDRATQALSALEGAEVVQVEEDLVMFSIRDASRKLPVIFSALERVGAEVRETSMIQPSLESLFIKLTGKELRE